MIYPKDLSLDEYKELLSVLHKHILKIAVEIKRICDENNLQYFLVGGSLLGAIRHQGFIPWDDDMDIGLFRDDYEKFLRLCRTELGPEFHLVSTQDEEHYGLPFAKILLKNTVFLEKGAPNYSCGNGIYVDVFPVDKIPDSVYERKMHNAESAFFRYALLKKNGYRDSNPQMTMKKRVVITYANAVSREHLIKRMDQVATHFNKRDTQYYYNTGSAYKYGKEVFPVESLTGELPEYLFEAVLFKGPKEPEKILEMLYGDYMSLPPEDKRYNRHGIVAIDFDSGTTESK